MVAVHFIDYKHDHLRNDYPARVVFDIRPVRTVIFNNKKRALWGRLVCGIHLYLFMSQSTPSKPKRYIDLMVDFSFKRAFGSEPNKDLLIAFLNEIFKGRKRIVDLSYDKNEHPGDTKLEGGAIFDLLCTADNGEKFLVEVQRGKQRRFKERLLFYFARLIIDLAPKGDRMEWGYNIPEVYIIALLEDFTLEDSEPNEYLYDICLCNRDTGKIFYDKLNFTYIELHNFVKTETALETDLDRWLHLLKHISSYDRIPAYFRKPIFEKLFNIAEYTNLTQEEKKMYDSSLKYKWDNKNVLDYAVEEAVKETDIKARKEERLTIARALKKEGLATDFIAKTTNLSIEEIEKL